MDESVIVAEAFLRITLCSIVEICKANLGITLPKYFYYISFFVLLSRNIIDCRLTVFFGGLVPLVSDLFWFTDFYMHSRCTQIQIRRVDIHT